MDINSILATLATGGPVPALQGAMATDPNVGPMGGRNGPTPDQKPGLLSRLMGGVNQFSNELLHPSTPLGQFGMYLSAASGAPLGRAGVAAAEDQRQAESDQAERDYRNAQAQAALFKAYAPRPENVGGILGMVDPQTGNFTQTYAPPTDAERYATSLGYNNGTDDWNNAVKDYVLRSRGPTAFNFASDMEDQRQQDRVDLENHRQGNRVTLRGMPTYSDTHARPRQPKVIGGVPDTGPGKPSKGVVTVRTPQEADALPSGTVFKTPDGRMKVAP